MSLSQNQIAALQQRLGRQLTPDELSQLGGDESAQQQPQTQQGPNISGMLTSAAASKGASMAGNAIGTETGLSTLPALPLAGAAVGTYASLDSANKIRQGKDPGMEGNVALGLNPMTAPFYWGGKMLGFGQSDKWKTEGNRLKALVDQGVLPQTALSGVPTQGRSKQDLIDLEKQKTAAGQFSNEKFAQSRDEKDLTGKDIWGYATFGENLGKNWMAGSEQARQNIADEALKEGKVREHNGTVDVDWTPDLLKYAQGQLGTPAQGSSGSPQQTSQQRKPTAKTPTAKAPPAPPPVVGPVAPPQFNLLPGPATTVANGGPSPYQPIARTPDDFGALMKQILDQNQVMIPRNNLYGA